LYELIYLYTISIDLPSISFAKVKIPESQNVADIYIYFYI